MVFIRLTGGIMGWVLSRRTGWMARPLLKADLAVRSPTGVRVTKWEGGGRFWVNFYLEGGGGMGRGFGSV